jgi:fluoride exporter
LTLPRPRPNTPTMLNPFLQVALGGAIGSVARYGVSMITMRAFGPGFPLATMLVNVAGSFLMGALVVALAKTSGTRLAPFLMTGLLGGFTTFSAFSLDAVTLWQRNEAALAAGYVMGSVVLSIAALFLGMAAARSFWP